MARPRTYPPNTSTAQRIAISDARLKADGGAKKAFRLSAAAHRALQYLMGCPNAPATELALIERLLISASTTSRQQHQALLGAPQSDWDDPYPRPFEYLVLGRAPDEEPTRRWFAKPAENVIIPSRLWSCHTLVRYTSRGQGGAVKLALDLALQVLWAGGRVLVADDAITTGPIGNALLKRAQERFPGMQVIKAAKDLKQVQRAFDTAEPHPGGSSMLYVCGAAAHTKDDKGYNAFVNHLRQYLGNVLGAQPEKPRLPRLPYLIISKASSADGIFRHVCAAQVRAVGSAHLVLAEDDDPIAPHVSANVTSYIDVDIDASASPVRFRGRITRRSGAGTAHDFIIDGEAA